MKAISKMDFKKMQELNLIKDKKNNKNFSITGRKKKSDRKKHYVEENAYRTYCQIMVKLKNGLRG